MIMLRNASDVKQFRIKNLECKMKDSFSEKASEKLFNLLQNKKLLWEFFVLYYFKETQ